MKAIIILAAVIGFSSAASAEFVMGHTAADGTYVEGYYRTKADSTTANNYSTQGNENPYTGKVGTVNPYRGGVDASIPLQVRPVQIGNPMDYALQAAQLQQMQLQNQAYQRANDDYEAQHAAAKQWVQANHPEWLPSN